VAKASGWQLPLDQVRLQARGRFQIVPFRGVLYARAWPRKRGKRGTPAQIAAREAFTQMVEAVRGASAVDVVAAMELATGTEYTWRDVLSALAHGSFVQVEGFQMVTTQAALDVLSEAVGAMIIRGPDGWVALLPSTDGNVLTTHGSNETPTWETPGGGATGALTLIASQVASSSSALAWTGLTSFASWQLRGRLLVPATTNVVLRLRFGTGAGPTYIASGYDYEKQLIGSGGFAANPVGTAQVNIPLMDGVKNAAPGLSCDLAIFTDHTSVIRVTGTINFQSNDNKYYSVRIGAGVAVSAPVTAMEITSSSGNIASGTASLYGLSE